MTKEELLIEREKYLSSGSHIGMISKTKDMEKFIYKVRPNGLAVLNISVLDKRIRMAAGFLGTAERALVVSRKESGHEAVQKFAETTGFRYIIGRFMPGSLTNPTYEKFFEPDVLVVTDPASDRQALKEAIHMRIPIVGLADTFNLTSFLDLIIPCNNKGKKSLSLIYYLLAKKVCRLKEKEFNATLEDFGFVDDKTKPEEE
ncbi:MAG: 30S ribosomal protein S2 [Candidatus Aenigmarchaeota archaeon]|nr:30S ribosomal protein S2 [Candidatus Aenigmarchaeota archaeon]